MFAMIMYVGYGRRLVDSGEVKTDDGIQINPSYYATSIHPRNKQPRLKNTKRIVSNELLKRSKSLLCVASGIQSLGML